MTIKVGIISDCLGNTYGGVGKYTYELIREFVRQDDPRFSFCLIDYADQGPFPTLPRLRVPNPFPAARTYCWYPYMARKVAGSPGRFDIIHNPTQIPTYFEFPGKNILTVHDLTPFLTPAESRTGRSLVYRVLFPKTLQRADWVIADSASTKRDLVRLFSADEEKISVIHLGIDASFHPRPKPGSLADVARYRVPLPYILYVGTIEPRKNIGTLIRSFSLLKRQGPPHKLVVVGPAGWKYKKIFRQIRELGLEHEIFFTGFVAKEDLPSLYSCAGVLVYPSWYEGFGFPPLEAMACGCPVVCSNTSSLPEVVGDAGILVDPGDAAGLAKAILRVINDDDLREGMVRKGLRHAAGFTWERCAKETLEVYARVNDLPERQPPAGR